MIPCGRVKTLGVATPKRSVFLPDVPTFSEQGIPVVVANWYGIASVAGTPAPVLDRLHAALMQMIAMPEVKERLSQGGLEPAPMSQQDFRRMIAEDVKVWAEVVRSANLQSQ